MQCQCLEFKPFKRWNSGFKTISFGYHYQRLRLDTYAFECFEQLTDILSINRIFMKCFRNRRAVFNTCK